MRINKAAPITTLAAAAVVALAGCVTIDTGSKDDEAGEAPGTSAPAKPERTQSSATTPTPSETPSSAPSDEDSTEDEDLGDPTYVHANDFGSLVQPSPVMGPYWESWYIDGEDVTYAHQSCLGTTALKVTGKLTDGELVWDDGEDPWPGDQTTETTPVDKSDETLKPKPISVEASTTDFDSEKAQFISYCKDRGEDVAGVFAE